MSDRSVSQAVTQSQDVGRRRALLQHRFLVTKASVELRRVLATQPHITALDLAGRVVGGSEGHRTADFWQALCEAQADGRVRTSGTTAEGLATLALCEAGTCRECGVLVQDVEAGLCSKCALKGRLARYRADALSFAVQPPQEVW